MLRRRFSPRRSFFDGAVYHRRFSFLWQSSLQLNESSTIYRTAYQRFEQVKCKRIDKAQQTDIQLTTVSLDIECSMSGELYSIGLYSETCQQVLMIASTEEVLREQNEHADTDLDIIWQADEKALLLSLLAWFRAHDPDIVIGWNVINFDFNLLQKRYELHGIKVRYWTRRKSTALA